MSGVNPLLTFIVTGHIWPDLSRHQVGVWDRLSLVFNSFRGLMKEWRQGMTHMVALWPVFILVCVLSHCGVVDGNKNLLR